MRAFETVKDGVEGVRFKGNIGAILLVEVCAGAAVNAPFALGVAGAMVVVAY